MRACTQQIIVSSESDYLALEANKLNDDHVFRPAMLAQQK